MEPLIRDSNAHARMAALEHFLRRYLEPRHPEYGEPNEELWRVGMPDPLRRLLQIAWRWPGHGLRTPFVTRLGVQDTLCRIGSEGNPPPLLMDDRLVFVWENQGVWVAATERIGDDPPVWISENCSHREERRVWRLLEKPLSHFLVSFALQELMFESEILAVASEALEKFAQAGFSIEPVWLNGEYAWGIDRPSYFLIDNRFLLRRARAEANGDDWYGCNSAAGAEILTSLGLPSAIV